MKSNVERRGVLLSLVAIIVLLAANSLMLKFIHNVTLFIDTLNNA